MELASLAQQLNELVQDLTLGVAVQTHAWAFRYQVSIGTTVPKQQPVGTALLTWLHPSPTTSQSARPPLPPRTTVRGCDACWMTRAGPMS
jgi:hypothetical protein